MTIDIDRFAEFDTISLRHGAHSTPDDGMCLLEAVAFVAGEPHGDTPQCVCPVLAAFGRAWNDGLPDDETRDRLLKPFLPRLIGTRSTPEVQDRRAFMAADWAVRVYTPAWLRRIGLDAEADALVGLPELTSVELCSAAMPVIDLARKKSAAAWAAAGDAAWAAARDAARDAAWAAARDAAWAAARDAARDAAWAAAWAAAGDAAWAAARDAAGDAARDAAGDAARAAARDAAGDAARAAAGDAAWDALKDTVTELQASAAELYGRMILCGVNDD